MGYDTAGADTFFNGKLDDLSIFSSVLSVGGISLGETVRRCSYDL